MGRIEKFRFYRQTDDNNAVVKKALVNAQKKLDSWKNELDELNPKILMHYLPFRELSQNPVKRNTEANQTLEQLKEITAMLQTSDFKTIAKNADQLWLKVKQQQTSSYYDSWTTDDRGINNAEQLKHFFEQHEQKLVKKVQTLESDLNAYNNALKMLSNQKHDFAPIALEQNTANHTKRSFYQLFICLLVVFFVLMLTVVVLTVVLWI